MHNDLITMVDRLWNDLSRGFDYSCPQYSSTVKVVPNLLRYNFKLENDGAVQIFTYDLPGVKKEDLTLEVVEDNKLRLSYERDKTKYAYDVIPSKEYDVETADAKLELGVLEIRFSKREMPAKKKIVVK